MYMYIYVYVYIYIYTHICVYTYMHGTNIRFLNRNEDTAVADVARWMPRYSM